MKKPKATVFDVINTTILCLITVICLYPFLYILFESISDGIFLSRGEVSFFPKNANIESFKYILSTPRFHVNSGLLNSFIYTFFGTLVAVMATYVTAYVLSRLRFVHRNFIMSLFVITWVFEAGIIPSYIVLSKFGFVDNPLVMIIPGCIHVDLLIITKSFFAGIPNEIEESALIDGANDFTIMTKIYMPISSTIIATLSTFYAIAIWNQYLIPQIYLKSAKFQVIQQVLKNVVITDSSSGTTFQNIMKGSIMLNQQNLKAAATFIAMVPVICLYPFVLKYFRKGILIGAVKG